MKKSKSEILGLIQIYKTDYGLFSIDPRTTEDEYKLLCTKFKEINNAIEPVYVNGCEIGGNATVTTTDDGKIKKTFINIPYTGSISVELLVEPSDGEKDDEFARQMHYMIRDNSDMFRAPNHVDCGQAGDLRKFLWVVEPIKGFIYGKAYSVSRNEEYEAKDPGGLYGDKRAKAYEEMLLRVGKARYNKPEGSDWNAFL